MAAGTNTSSEASSTTQQGEHGKDSNKVTGVIKTAEKVKRNTRRR
jgi:hypothetical protein